MGTGSWRRIQSTHNDPQIIWRKMRELKSMFPGVRVRAVDHKGRLLDVTERD